MVRRQSASPFRKPGSPPPSPHSTLPTATLAASEFYVEGSASVGGKYDLGFKSSPGGKGVVSSEDMLAMYQRMVCYTRNNSYCQLLFTRIRPGRAGGARTAELLAPDRAAAHPLSPAAHPLPTHRLNRPPSQPTQAAAYPIVSIEE